MNAKTPRTPRKREQERQEQLRAWSNFAFSSPSWSSNLGVLGALAFIYLQPGRGLDERQEPGTPRKREKERQEQLGTWSNFAF
jgi:hypothetical protein